MGDSIMGSPRSMFRYASTLAARLVDLCLLTSRPQWFMFDCTEILPEEELSPSEYELTGTRYDGQIAVLGRHLHERIMGLRYFLVGAGAIG